MKWFLALIFLVASLAITGYLASDRSGIIETAQEQAVMLPPPDRSGMMLVQTLGFFDEEVGAGLLLFYDDTQTNWQIDYIELYDSQDNLLLIAWLDRFGTCRAVMDRGFLDTDNPNVDGVMVPIAVGTII
ncbi:MAG TPA: hypothetical protein VF089_12590 [Candidatus Binatia bacterium]